MSNAPSRAILAIAAGVFMAGCYSYKPVVAARPGMEVRARLSNEAAVRRSQGYDEPILSLDGKVVEATSDALKLDILIVRSSSAFQNVEMRDTVQLANNEIQSILQRKISPGRTALVTIGGAVGIFALVKGIDQVVGGTGDDDGGGDPTFRVPLSSLLTYLLPVFRRQE
jgi:hypothetical protein